MQATRSSPPRRRAERRDPVSLPVRVYSALFDGPAELASADLSPAGIFLPCDVLLPEDEPVLIGFTLPGSCHQMLIDGRVARAARHGRSGVGIEFGKLPAVEEAALRAALERLCVLRAAQPPGDGAFRC
jgi:hypothetical protein